MTRDRRDDWYQQDETLKAEADASFYHRRNSRLVTWKELARRPVPFKGARRPLRRRNNEPVPDDRHLLPLEDPTTIAQEISPRKV